MLELKDIENKLNTDGFIVSDIKGVSMLPLLKQERDRVIITKLSRPLKKYDIVLYKTKSDYVLHRIIDINENKLLIRGDNCINTESINTSDVLGILTAYYRKDEYIELTDKINEECFIKSNNSVLFRRVKAKLKRIFVR